MSARSDISSTGAEAKALGDIERGVRAGAARALRTRAAIQRQRAADGTSTGGDKNPSIVIQTGEAAVAARLVGAFELLADEIEAGAPI